MGQTAIVNEFVDDGEAQFNFINNEHDNSTENNSYDDERGNN